MTRGKIAWSLVAVAATLALVWNLAFTVGQAQEALVLRFGAPVRVANADGRSPGLYPKWPLLEQVVRLDRRTLILDGRPQPLASSDQGRLNVQASLRYHIADPVQFYRAVGSTPDGGERLQALLDASVGEAIAGPPAPASGSFGVRMAAALAYARRATAREQLGVQLDGVELISVAPADVEAVGRRMLASDVAQAVQTRAQGEAAKRVLLAQADRDAADIRGEGERQALELRGEGDAERASILGAAYGQDAGFANVFRRLEAYDQAMNPANTTLVLSADNAFLDVFAHGPKGVGNPR